MADNSSKYNLEVHKSVKGIVGDIRIRGGNIILNIISDQPEDSIKERKLVQESPYKGLETFEPTDKDKFFGREQLIDNLSKYLEHNNLLLLLGASGSGKSSLIHAGIVPKFLDQGFVNLTFVPDKDPFTSLFACLQRKYRQEKAEIAQKGEADTLIQVVNELKKDSRWFIFIDQFEELFTISHKAKRDKFIDSLIKLIKETHKDNSIKIVLTMRADFLDKISPYPNLVEIHDRYSRMLTDMSSSELRLAIAEPAARNGVVFQAGLVDLIINDLQGQGRAGSLPLLQYTLDLLWKKDDIRNRILNTQTYYDLGRVTGALKQQANKVYDELLQEEKEAAKQIFLDLVEVVGESVVSRRADKANFNGDVMERTLDTLIRNRLVVVSKQNKQKPSVAVAHEALLTSWEKLQGWIKEAAEIIILKNRLIDDARHWSDLQIKKTQKADNELWSGSKLERVIKLREQPYFSNLSAEVNQFVSASIAKRDRQLVEEKRRKRDRLLAKGAIGATVIALIVLPPTLAGNILWTLQHRSYVVFAKPGQNINGKTNYRISHRKDDEYDDTLLDNQIVFGIPGEIESTDCINVGLSQGEELQSEHLINLTAPKKPGVYYIQFGTENQDDCNSVVLSGNAKTTWQSSNLKTDPAEKKVGVVIVGNPIDLISHGSKVVSAYYENIPQTVTKRDYKRSISTTIFVSLENFSINPAMSK